MSRVGRGLRRGRTFARVRGPGLVYGLLMVAVPVAIMLLARDKKDRYLLPMLAPACVLAAEALRLAVRDAKRRPRGAAALFGIHWFVLLVMVVGVPVAAMFLPKDEYVAGSGAWLAPAVAVPLIVGGGLLWLGSIWLWRSRGTGGLLAGTVTCVVFAGHAFLVGYGDSREAKTDLKPIAEVIRREVPDAQLWHSGGNVPPGLIIYSGRTVGDLPDDLSTLDPARPHVWIVRQRRADRDPDPVAPTGFDPEPLTVARRDRSLWWAFLKPATLDPD